MRHFFAEYTASRGVNKEPISLDAERRRRPRRPVSGEPVGVGVPVCRVSGVSIDDDEGGLYNFDDMQVVRECRDHYTPF